MYTGRHHVLLLSREYAGYLKDVYFGPIYVKFSGKARSNQAIAKRYGVIFTCLTVRAVHIELASDLTTDVFFLAETFYCT